MRTRRCASLGVLTIVAMAALTLTGCANAAAVRTAGAATSSQPVAPSSVPPSIAPTVPNPTTVPSSPPPLRLPPSTKPIGSPGPQQTISGVVTIGAEPGCTILTWDGVQYLLLNGDPSVVRDGAHVSVVGNPVTGVFTHCMQGKPFVVTSARPTG